MSGRMKYIVTVLFFGLFFIPMFGVQNEEMKKGYEYFKNTLLNMFYQFYFQESDIKRINFYDTSDYLLGFIYLDKNIYYSTNYSNVNEGIIRMEYVKFEQPIIDRIITFERQDDSSWVQTNIDSSTFIILDSLSYSYTNFKNENEDIEIEKNNSYHIIYETDKNIVQKTYCFNDISIILARKRHFFDWLLSDWRQYKIIVRKNKKYEYILISSRPLWWNGNHIYLPIPSYYFFYENESLN